jgi:hypothetical protein
VLGRRRHIDPVVTHAEAGNDLEAGQALDERPVDVRVATAGQAANARSDIREKRLSVGACGQVMEREEAADPSLHDRWQSIDSQDIRHSAPTGVRVKTAESMSGFLKSLVTNQL